MLKEELAHPRVGEQLHKTLTSLIQESENRFEQFRKAFEQEVEGMRKKELESIDNLEDKDSCIDKYQRILGCFQKRCGCGLDDDLFRFADRLSREEVTITLLI